MKVRHTFKTSLSLPTGRGISEWGAKWGYGQPDWPVLKLKIKGLSTP